MFVLDFLGKYYVEIQGDGELAGELKQYYERLITDKEISDPDLKIVEWGSEVEPEIVLGEPEYHYGRNSNEYIIRHHKNHVSIGPDWKVLRTSPRTSRYFLSQILEFKVRRELAQHGFALIHASSIKLEDQVYVFPAWRHTGKTNLMLSLLQNGGGYLSDDRVWVHESGSIHGYPLPINMLPYNFKSFPDLLEASRSERVRTRMANFLNEHCDIDRSIIDKILIFITRYYLEVGLGSVAQLNDLLSDCHFVNEAEIDEMVFLRTETDERVKKADLDEELALEELVTTSDHEWNAVLREYCRAHDILFDNGCQFSAYQSLVEREKEIFKRILSENDISRLNLPREENWLEKGITKQVQHIFDV